MVGLGNFLTVKSQIKKTNKTVTWLLKIASFCNPSSCFHPSAQLSRAEQSWDQAELESSLGLKLYLLVFDVFFCSWLFDVHYSSLSYSSFLLERANDFLHYTMDQMEQTQSEKTSDFALSNLVSMSSYLYSILSAWSAWPCLDVLLHQWSPSRTF